VRMRTNICRRTISSSFFSSSFYLSIDSVELALNQLNDEENCLERERRTYTKQKNEDEEGKKSISRGLMQYKEEKEKEKEEEEEEKIEL